MPGRWCDPAHLTPSSGGEILWSQTPTRGVWVTKMAVPVARRNLFAEKGRFAISVSGVAFAVLLILIVVALYRGWSRAGEVFEQLPGQLWVVQQGTSDPFHSVSLLEPDQLQEVAGVPGVQAVVPVLQRQMTIPAGDKSEAARLMALDVDPALMSQELRERFLPGRGQIVIEEVFSRKSGLHEGDSINVNGVSLTVAQVRSRGSDVIAQFAFVNFTDAAQIFGVGDVVNYGMVILADGADVTAAKHTIEERDQRLKVYTATEFADSIRQEVNSTFIPIILILVVIGFIVGTAVVGLTIYTATIERAREFGVMKATGASALFIYRIVLSQSALLTAAGFALGVLAALVTADLAERAVPEFATEFRPADLVAVLLAAAAMGVFASFMPVRRINSIDPAVVFRA